MSQLFFHFSLMLGVHVVIFLFLNNPTPASQLFFHFSLMLGVHVVIFLFLNNPTPGKDDELL